MIAGRTRRPWCRWIVGLTVILAAVVVAVGSVPARRLWIMQPASWPADPFSAAAWQSSAPRDRFRFYKDLDRRRLLENRTRGDVERLLGTPDYASPRGSYVDYTLLEWSRENMMLGAVVFLQIEFDDRGRAAGHHVRSE